MSGESEEVKKNTILYFNLFTWLGGGEYSVFHLAKNLNRSKYHPLMLFNKDGPFVEKVKTAGIETVIIPFAVAKPISLLKPQNIIRNWKASLKILNLIRDRRIDIVQCSDVYALLLLIPSLLRSRFRVIYNVIIFYSLLRYWFFNILALLFINRIVVNSTAVKNDLVNKTIGLPQIASVAHNGVDTSLFYPRSVGEITKIISKLGIPTDKKIIGLIGRYEVWKGHLTFLDAAKRLLQNRNDLYFLIVGGAITSEVAPAVSRYKQKVIRRIDELMLQPSIMCCDHRDDIPEIMAALDVCVCPSDYEPYGLVLLEAYVSGVPVVASSTVGALEVLPEKQGVFVAEPMNPDSFVREINNALCFDRTILTNQGGIKSSDQFSWQTYTQTFEDLYEKVKRT